MLEFHEHAELFPLMTEAELRGLVEDIREHGQRDPIVTLDGKILDGRNRYRACQELGIEPTLEPWSGEGSPQAFVISHNLHRRHLSASQRAIIGARLATRTKEDTVSNLRKGNNPPGVGIPAPGVQEIAKLLNISRDTVAEAKLLLRKGTPEEIAAVESGSAAVSTVAQRIRDAVPPGERLKKPPRKPDRDPEAQQRRGDKLRANAQLWGLFRDAVKNLTALPDANEMVRIVKANDKARMTNAKLAIALNYLREFSNAWNSHDKQEAA